MILRALAILIVVTTLAAPSRATTLFALASTNRLVKLDAATPGTLTLDLSIGGLPGGETLVGLDFRPANGQLYALSDTGRLYTINPTTALATQVSATAFATLTGADRGFDFNPVPDRARVVTNADENLRVVPDTGALGATDTPLNYAVGDVNAAQNPNVVGVGYTNAYPGATTTTLYGIDSGLDVLVTINPPNNGALNTVGALGVDVGPATAFDISTTNAGYLAAPCAANSCLYTVNLVTGAITLVGQLGPATLQTIGLAVEPQGAQLSAATYSVNEAAGNATITLERVGATDVALTVTVVTADGTATAGSDYTASSQTVTFNPGEATKSVVIAALNDTTVEGDETIHLTLTGPTVLRRTAVLTIVDDEVPDDAGETVTDMATGGPAPDLSTGAPDDDDEGCDCSLGHGPTSGSALALFLAALALFALRRRARD